MRRGPWKVRTFVGRQRRQRLGAQPRQILRRPRLHARRDLLAEQFQEQLRHGQSFSAGSMSVCAKSLPLNSSGSPLGLRHAIHHAVAEVQLGRMTAAAVNPPRLARMFGVFRRERHHFDPRLAHRIVKPRLAISSPFAVDGKRRFEPCRRRHAARAALQRWFRRNRRPSGFVEHDGQKRRGVDNHFGNPFSSYIQLVSELTGSRMWARISFAIAMTWSTAPGCRAAAPVARSSACSALGHHRCQALASQFSQPGLPTDKRHRS